MVSKIKQLVKLKFPWPAMTQGTVQGAGPRLGVDVPVATMTLSDL